MVDVIVEHDYTALQQDELTIKKGDVIHEVIKMKGGWWEGSLNDKRGMFPDNFVKEIDEDSSNHNRRDVVTMRQCRVVFSYRQDHMDELELNVGDTIDIIGEEEEGWWRGISNGREGVFPSNFVKEIKSKPSNREDSTNIHENDLTPTLPPKPAKIVVQAKYGYTAQNDDELTLKEGDLITLISRDGQDPGWWRGELNGQTGVFPDNFVVLLDEGNLCHSDSVTSKTTTTASQRKSLEVKSETDNVVHVSPSVPSKKPVVPVKKSPSGSNSQAGIIAGLRKKNVDSTSSSKNHSHFKMSETKHEWKEVERTFVTTEVKLTKVSDMVDGSSSSKGQPQLLKVTDVKDEFREELILENAFDHVERSSMLSDVRATRAKAPGRRPPSVIFKDGEPGVVNGNTDHIQMDLLSDSFSNSRPSSVSDQSEILEAKPRVREWEKHKAPWLEEMKLNQAKRTSPLPISESNKLKLTPSDKSGSPDSDEVRSPFEKSISDTSLSLSTTSNSSKQSPNTDKSPSSLKQNIPRSSAKPSVSNDQSKSHSNNKSHTSSKPQVACRSPDVKATGDVHQEHNCFLHYMELLQRIEKLETLMELQQQTYTTTIEELRGKIVQLENELRDAI